MTGADKTGVERRDQRQPCEARSGPNGPMLTGYGIVFGRKSENLGGFEETVDERAITKTLKDGADVVGLHNHDPNQLLGRLSNQTLRLIPDMTGLRYEIDVNPKDPQAMAVYARAERGDLRGSSFAFETIQDAWDWEASPPQRKLMEIKLFDVGPVTRPAYPDSTVATRALEKLAAEVQKPVETLLGAIQDGRIREELENDTVEYRLEPETTSNTGESAELRAVWSTAYVNDLPDSAFLHIEDGGTKDSEGKTTPRTLRHFPYKDASGNVDLPHLRNALARIPQSNLPQSVKDAATAKAEKLLKAEQNSLEDGELRVGKKFSAATVQAVQKIIFDLQSLVENDPDRMPTEEDDEDEEAAEDVAETIGQNTLERIAAKAEELRVLTTGSDDEEEGKKLSTATASAIVIARSRAHEALKLMSGR